MEYELAGGAEWRPVRAEPAYLAAQIRPLSGTPLSFRPGNLAGGRQRHGKDQREGTAGNRVSAASAVNRPAHGWWAHPGTLPRLPGACRAVMREVAGTWPLAGLLGHRLATLQMVGHGGRSRQRPATRTHTRAGRARPRACTPRPAICPLLGQWG